MDTAEIRRRFLAHFEAAGHAVVDSASTLANDPNLLFVNAGMVPFKPYFLGQETPPFDRATSVQKCIRTPDIEDVGKTTRHATFFEMCGNFSFGDYFKEGAIELAWSLVTNPVDEGGYGLDKDRLYPSVLVGDDEAIELWMKVTGLPRERIVQLGPKENYWSMGVPGPGGPCSEILFDRGPDFGPDFDATTLGPDMPVDLEDRLLEIWNLVFMQDDLSAVRSKSDFDIAGSLPKKNIDTGMGLDRVALLLQGKKNVYEIDLLYPVIARAEQLSGKTYGVDARGRRPVLRRRRPRALVDDAHRRRRHPRQRRPRLRPAPAAAPCRALDAPARLRGPGAARADADLPRRDGAGLRQPRHRLGAHRAGGVRRGGRVPQDAPVRHPDLRPGRRRGEADGRRDAVRRARLRAPRHLRLPDRPHPRDGGRAGADRRRAGLPRPDGRAARARQGRRPRQEGRRTATRSSTAGSSTSTARPSGWPTRRSRPSRARSPC